MKYSSVVTLLFGYCSCALFMELLMAQNPNSANLVTFLTFLFTTLYHFVFIIKWGSMKPEIPLTSCIVLIISYFVTYVGINYAYTLHVPPTLHSIIRSLFPTAAMFIGFLHNEELPLRKHVVGSLLITIGVAISLYGGVPADKDIFIKWCSGVTLLVITSITNAYSMYQEQKLFYAYGLHLDELVLYTHGVPLPLFLGIYPELIEILWNLSRHELLLIFLIILLQFCYVISIKDLATNETMVTITFILTLRRFISLFISAVIFKDALTVYHVIGIAFVTVGTYVYYNFFARNRQWPFTKRIEQE